MTLGLLTLIWGTTWAAITIWLLEHMEARQVALIGYGTPIVALILGVVFMNESLTTRTLVGSALVVVGVAVASHAKRRRSSGDQARVDS